MLKLLKNSIVLLTVILIGCGTANKAEDEIKSIGISVPLASIVDCSQVGGQFVQPLPDGRCAVFLGYASVSVTLPFAAHEIQSIRLELLDPSGNKHVIGQLNQNMNTIQSNGVLFLTDVQNPNQAVARITFQGSNQVFVEIDLSGSQTMGQLYQSFPPSQTTVPMQLVFVKKQD